MATLRLLCVLMLLSSPVLAQRESMSAVDYALWGASTALLVVDWGQTHAMVERRIMETNPILGPRPSSRAINTTFVAVLVSSALASRLNSRELRRVLWAVVLGAEIAAVSNNHALNVGWTMRW